MPYNPVDLAYIAGIIDGDGHIGISRNIDSRPRKEKGEIVYHLTPRIQVQMSDLEAILFIQDIFGGTILTQDYDYRSSPLFSISYRSIDDCDKVLNSILPYLKVKKKQAVLLMEYVKVRKSKFFYTNIEFIIWEQMKKLNRGGRQNALC